MKKLCFLILIFLLVFIQSCKKDTVETANEIIAPTGEQSYGRCIDNKDGTMTIKINSYYFDKVAPVFLAKTILHETIHAYIYQEVEALGGYSNIENSTFKIISHTMYIWGLVFDMIICSIFYPKAGKYIKRI